MGWRDRDWGKFDEAEWNDLLGGGTTTLPAPRPARRSGRPVVSAVVALAALVSFGATVGVDAVHKLTNTNAVVATPPSNVVAIHWRDTDLSPAQTTGRICVNDSRLGTVCAEYATGEKPADALTGRLQALGASVRSG